MIVAKNLNKSYSKENLEIPVLKDLSLEIIDNESVAILGDSGSGKTTLLSLLGGLETVSKGSIEFFGTEIHNLDQAQLTHFRAQNLGIVFQQYHLMDYLTALENVALPLEIAGDPRAEEKASELLKEVGLEHRGDHLPAQLSGGECQRVALARALVTQPKVILADEPTGSLDSNTGNNVMDLLFKMKELHKTTLILVTHNEVLAQRCDRILRMKDGQLIQVENCI